VEQLDERRLRSLNPALVELLHRRTTDYEAAAISRTAHARHSCTGCAWRAAGLRSDSWSADPRC
jgi:hypothetical protein